MAEFTSTIQQVAAGQNAILDTDVIKSRCVSHRTGSGLICVDNAWYRDWETDRKSVV